MATSVFVRSPAGATVSLSLDPGVASVQQLRQAVEAALGVPAPLQLLQCGTQRLFPDSATLRQCGVRQFSTVNVLMRVCGGIDFQHRDGSKPGSGGVASAQQQAIDRRERLRQLAMETVDLAKDPYYFVNHSGVGECRLCLTLHKNEGHYLAHTQGKKHQTNLARRAAMERAQAERPMAVAAPSVRVRKSVKIGRPGYKVTKQRDPETGQRSLEFEVKYPEIDEGVRPRHRFMGAFEQRVAPPSKDHQYLLFAADPYETIGFCIPSLPVDKHKFRADWDLESKTFTVSVHFTDKPDLPSVSAPKPGPREYVGRNV